MRLVSKQKRVDPRLYKRTVFKTKRPGAKAVHNVVPVPSGTPFNLHVFEGEKTEPEKP